MSDETWVDEVKQKFLNETGTSDEVTAMISYSPTNKIINQGLAKYVSIVRLLCSHMKGKYRCFLDPYLELLEMQYMGIDGEARNQAIRMRAELARFEMSQKEGGIAKLLKGNS